MILFLFDVTFLLHLDNFNMSKKKPQKGPEFEVSFAKHNNRQIAEDNRLTVEMLRVHATEKQRIMKEIWLMDQ